MGGPGLFRPILIQEFPLSHAGLGGQQPALHRGIPLEDLQGPLRLGFLRLCRQGGGAQQHRRQQAEGQGQAAFGELDTKMKEMVQYNVEQSQKSANEIYTTYLFAMVLMIAFAVGAVIVGGMISTGIRLVIVNALQKIRVALKELQGGNLDAELTYRSRDEFGELSDDIREFMGNLEDIIKDENEIFKLTFVSVSKGQ